MINVTRCMRGFRRAEWRVANPPRNAEERRGGGGELRRAETEKASYYYQFACLRSLGLPLSSFHLDDTGGLFPPIYFSAPIRDSASLLSSSSIPLEDTLEKLGARARAVYRGEKISVRLRSRMLAPTILAKSCLEIRATKY
jgi:hypothetical protein